MNNEEPVYEAIPAGPGIYYDDFVEGLWHGFADGVTISLEIMRQYKPAPIEVEAEVIKTEINRPTRGLLEAGHESN